MATSLTLRQSRAAQMFGGGNFTPPATYYLALLSDTGSYPSYAVTELTGTGYARIPIPNDAEHWTAPDAEARVFTARGTLLGRPSINIRPLSAKVSGYRYFEVAPEVITEGVTPAVLSHFGSGFDRYGYFNSPPLAMGGRLKLPNTYHMGYGYFHLGKPALQVLPAGGQEEDYDDA